MYGLQPAPNFANGHTHVDYDSWFAAWTYTQGNDLEIRYRSDKGQGHRVNKCILHTNDWSITLNRMIPVFKPGTGNVLGIS